MPHIRKIGNQINHWREALDRLLGLPNYERYLAHMQHTHPEQTPLSRQAFYDEAQRARYESGAERPRCC
ncbi:MAG: CstA-like transporter-associated (seleno)protein [Pseudomonadota bacterium]